MGFRTEDRRLTRGAVTSLCASANRALPGGASMVYLPSCIKSAEMVKQLPDSGHRGARILVVDDDESILEYLGHFVGAAGYDVVTATSAEGALIALQREGAQIVILDIIMPGMDGLALCRTIRSQSYSDYVYLILHTSKTTDADIVDGRAAGADDYIGKGASKDLIIERIRKAQTFLAFKQNP